MRVRRHRPHFQTDTTRVDINDYPDEDSAGYMPITITKPISTRRHNPYLREGHRTT